MTTSPCFFFFNDTATTEIYTLSLHDALPISLVRVVLPLSLPGLVTAVIFAFIAAWNEYIVALTLMTAPERKPLTVGITSYVTAYVQHWNHLFAASVIAIVPVVVLFALIERHLVGGLTAGSVK